MQAAHTVSRLEFITHENRDTDLRSEILNIFNGLLFKEAQGSCFQKGNQAALKC